MTSPCLTRDAEYTIRDMPIHEGGGRHVVLIEVRLPAEMALETHQHARIHDGVQLGIAAALAAEGKGHASGFAAHIVAAKLLNVFPPEDD